MCNLYVYLPCYNEAGNIEALTLDWLDQANQLTEQGVRLNVVIIDDKSTDNTLAIARSLEKEHDPIRVIAHEVNKNLGGGLTTAVNDFLSVADEQDMMCVMDGDNTQKPRFIFPMLDKIRGGAGCVIASRYQSGAEVDGVPLIRRLLSDGAKLYYTLVLQIPHVRDYTCGYRVYRCSALKSAKQKYGDSLITMRTFSCMMELLYKLHRSGTTFAEVPFHLYYDDKAGESKMKVLKTIKDSLVTALHLRFHA